MSDFEWSEEKARSYVEQYGEHVTNRMTVERAALQPSDVVVDVGCGSGAAVRAAAHIVAKAIGVDPTSTMVQIAQEQSASHPHADRVAFYESPARRLPLEANEATVVLSINSITHWDDLKEGLREVLRVLSSGGRFVVSFEDWEGSDWSDPFWTMDNVVAELQAAGFELILSEKLDILQAASDEAQQMIYIEVRKP